MKHILLTCDTEVGELHANRADAFEIFIEGKVDHQEVGVKLINGIANEYGAIVEHFVDIYPYGRYGEEKFRLLCNDILDSGHKVGLHTHPSGKYDKNRKFMWQYSLDEQVEIVRFGKHKIKEWTGVDNLSHRAGGYGADDNTLRALVANNIFVDSSYFSARDMCKISYPYKNKVSQYFGIFEIPVTVYEKKIYYKIFNARKNSFQKLDFRYGSSADDILAAIDLMPNNCVIVLFLHSFNFLNLIYNFKTMQYENISINHILIEEYKKLLNGISSRDSCKFSYSLDISKDFTTEDIVPTITKEENILKSIKQKIFNNFGIRGNI